MGKFEVVEVCDGHIGKKRGDSPHRVGSCTLLSQQLQAQTNARYWNPAVITIHLIRVITSRWVIFHGLESIIRLGECLFLIAPQHLSWINVLP